MKIINSVFVFVILVSGSQLSRGEKLNCEFKDVIHYLVGKLYSCVVTSLDNSHNNLTIDGYSGGHKANKNDADVKVIWIHRTNTKYIPTNLGSFSNLTALIMASTQLVEIKAKDFHGMQNLESIDFEVNKLSTVPLDAFNTLRKLRFIQLSFNQIEELPNGIFKNCLELKKIHLWNNKIKHLGTEIFNDLKKLDYVDLFGNICVNKEYRGETEIIQLKNDIKMKCKNPNEVSAMTTTTTRRTTTTTQNPTTTTTTTQNPMQVKNSKLEKELREVKETQQMNDSEAKKTYNGVKLNCKFKNLNFGLVGLLYSCVVTSLDNPHNNLTIEGYSGVHKANKNDADVKAIYIHDTKTNYIPSNLGSFSNLTLLMMMNTQLVEIKTKDFHGMQELEEINLSDNKLSSVPLDAFATLTKLRFIYLSSNQIEELPNGIFVNCLELEKIYLSDNKIKYLGTEIFNDLEKLDSVDFERNICVDDEYKGTTEITQLKDDIKMNCRNPNENPATTTTTTRRTTKTPTTTSTTQTPTTTTTTQNPTTTSTTQTPTTTTTTQNPMEVKLIEMQKQIIKLGKELKESKELQQTTEDALKKELREAKKERDALKKELSEAKAVQQMNESESKKESNGEKLNCKFVDVGYGLVGSVYSCEVKSFVNPYNNLTIDGYLGEHKANKNDTDVKGIYIHGTNTKYIPTNLGSLFNVTVLVMESTQLVEIIAKDFRGMKDLESINLNYNKLSSVPLDAFASLSKLRFIDLDYNQIEELPNEIFKNNLELKEIHLYGNKIKNLGTEILNDLKKLYFVDLEDNICVNKEYYGATEINQLKDDIKIKCRNPNEVPATTTTTHTPTTTSTTQTPTTTSTTSTTQNPMEVKIIEMQELISKLEKDLKESKELQQKNDAKATKASNGEKLNCEFRNMEYSIVGKLYSCYVSSLVNPHNNLNIDGYSGKHKVNKNDADVKVIKIRDTNTKYIPTNLGSLFNLTALHMVSTQLVEINAKDFHGMQDLESISFVHNKLSSIPLDAFTTLTKLIIIDLSSNQIEDLPNGIFVNNMNLEEMYLNHNRIKYLGTEIFNDLKKLNWVDLERNICVDKYYIGATQIHQLKEDIKMNCENPATTTSTSTTQNPMNFENELK